MTLLIWQGTPSVGIATTKIFTYVSIFSIAFNSMPYFLRLYRSLPIAFAILVPIPALTLTTVGGFGGPG